MSATRIPSALASATDTRAIEIGRGILDKTGAVFKEQTGARLGIVVADETTYGIAGKQVEQALRTAGIELAEPLIFPAQPPLYAGYENVTVIRERLEATGATACSVGSGTLSDLTKLASGELGRLYVHVCTAASMDGYSAFGASIAKDGFKITRNCPAPVGIIADLDVMATAPQRMLANGYGDIMEKFPGGADWIIADALGVEPIEPHAWDLVQSPLKEAMGDPAALRDGDPEVFERFVEIVMLSGLAIQAHQTSRPGSGVGHNFSHQWEMEGYGLDWPLPLSHGAKVGLGTVAIAAVYDAIIDFDFAVDVDAVVASWPSREENQEYARSLQTIPAIAEAAAAQADGKYVPREQLPQRIADIERVWPEIRGRLRAQVPTAPRIRDMLREVGAVYHPLQVGISLEKLHATYFQAQTIRSRYAVLDVLNETGLLRQVVDSLFAPGGYWAEEPLPEYGIVPPEVGGDERGLRP